MSSGKSIRHRHVIDMTPMVDLGFLLVSFFMMMTQFAPPDPVQVDIPRSSAESKLPDADLITILVSREGRALLTIEGKRNMQSLARIVSSGQDLQLSALELEAFSNLSGIGVAFQELPQFLNLSESEQKNIALSGIPISPNNNELKEWILYAMAANPRARVVIKGDRLAPYPAIKKIMDTLQDVSVNTFSLITDTKTLETNS